MSITSSIAIGIVKEVRPGKVKLSFPWINESYRTDWVSVAMPMSGKERGMFVMPEPEDEALVGFDLGKFDHPYVIGFLWNGVDKTPETEVKNRIFKTPGGHTLRFEDKDGAKRVVIKSSGEHTIVLDDTPAGNQITVTTKGKLAITLDDKSSSIELSGGGRSLKLSNGQVQIT